MGFSFRDALSAVVVEEGLNFMSKELDDTTAVITATTTFDKVLTNMILFNMGRMPTKSQVATVFAYPGPLSSFSAKIDLCYLMGSLTDEMKHDLDVLRKIRNDFCHADKKRSFSDADIHRRCVSLKYSLTTSTEPLKALEAVLLESGYTSEGRARFTISALFLFIFLMGFLYKKQEQVNILEKYQNEVNDVASTRISTFIDRLRARTQAAAEQGSPPPPEEASAPGKS